MQLTMTTDYAIRCLLYLSQHDGISTSQNVRAYAAISSDEHTRKILRQLKYGGLVRSDKGANGGYALTRPISKITFLDVIRCTEDSVKVNRCLEDPNGAEGRKDESLAMYHFYAQTQEMLENYFGNTTLQDIVDGTVSVPALTDARK